MKYPVEFNEFCQQNEYRCEWSSKSGYVRGVEMWEVHTKIMSKEGLMMYYKHHLGNAKSYAFELCYSQILRLAESFKRANPDKDEKVAPFKKRLDFVNCIFKV